MVKALNTLFHGKCAYCESPIHAMQPTDVEHFRPKKAVIHMGGERKPAYYWLAVTWENLLPSCIDCNRRRKHRLPDGTTIMAGKETLFPLADESRRAMGPGEHIREKPLLLDPCQDDPDKYLEFTEEGVVRPRRKNRRAEASIAVYGLQRPGLVQLRRDFTINLRAWIKVAEQLRAALDANPNDHVVLQLFQETMDNLKWHIAPQRAYSGMARQILKKKSLT